jgi:hypothetical protein
MLPHSKNGLSVAVTATEMEHTFHIPEHERLLLKRQHLPVLPTQVEVDAIGEGCALVQVGSIRIQHVLLCIVTFIVIVIIITGTTTTTTTIMGSSGMLFHSYKEKLRSFLNIDTLFNVLSVPSLSLDSSVLILTTVLKRVLKHFLYQHCFCTLDEYFNR